MERFIHLDTSLRYARSCWSRSHLWYRSPGSMLERKKVYPQEIAPRPAGSHQAILAPSPPYLKITTEVSRLPEAAIRHASKNLQSSTLNSFLLFNTLSSSIISFSVYSCHAYAMDLAAIASIRSTFIITCTRLIIDDALPVSNRRFSFSYDAISLTIEI